MKSITKRLGAFAACAALTTGIIAGTGIVAAATEKTDESNHYFYEQLKNDERAQKFYNAFDKLGNQGEYKNGTLEYDLIENGVLSLNDAHAYVNGANKKVPQSYGAGRDAYIMDHPDLFYADLFGTSISAGQQGDKTVAFLTAAGRKRFIRAISQVKARLILQLNGTKANLTKL